MTNVLKFDQVWQFPHKNGKYILCVLCAKCDTISIKMTNIFCVCLAHLVIYSYPLPPKKICYPPPPPPSPSMMLVPPLILVVVMYSVIFDVWILHHLNKCCSVEERMCVSPKGKTASYTKIKNVSDVIAKLSTLFWKVMKAPWSNLSQNLKRALKWWWPRDSWVNDQTTWPMETATWPTDIVMLFFDNLLHDITLFFKVLIGTKSRGWFTC